MFIVICRNGHDDGAWEFKGEFKNRERSLAIALARKLARENFHVIVRKHTASGSLLVWEGRGRNVFYSRA